MGLADTRFSDRRRAVAAKLAGMRIDTMLVTHLAHVYYLFGFTGSNAALTVSKDLSSSICTDGRYTTQIAEQVPDIEAVIDRPSPEALLRRIEGIRRVGFEAEYVTVAQLEALKEACGPDITLVPVRGVIEELRLVKDEGELADLRKVADLATRAFEDMIQAGELAVGRQEREVAADLEYRMRQYGSEHTSFDTIVASGPNSALPHHGADDRVLERGDLVTIDFGAHAYGVNSDMTRTLVLEEAGDFAKEIYQVVLDAQLAGVQAAKPGTELKAIDAACRDIIAAAGYGEYYVHSTGHGVGLDVHEAPFASTAGQGKIEPGMTLTIEPGIYVPGQGGVRIEDTLIITDGEPEIITVSDKQLRVL